jgi:hypothetical protein
MAGFDGAGTPCRDRSLATALESGRVGTGPMAAIMSCRAVHGPSQNNGTWAVPVHGTYGHLCIQQVLGLRHVAIHIVTKSNTFIIPIKHRLLIIICVNRSSRRYNLHNRI